MGVKWLCICTSKGGYFWNDRGTTFDERCEGGVINPWVEAFTNQYIKYIKERQDVLGGLHSARGAAFIRMTSSREGCLIKYGRMCFIYINGLCNVDAALMTYQAGACVRTFVSD